MIDNEYLEIAKKYPVVYESARRSLAVHLPAFRKIAALSQNLNNRAQEITYRIVVNILQNNRRYSMVSRADNSPEMLQNFVATQITQELINKEVMKYIATVVK